jgi:hypothetical protein
MAFAWIAVASMTVGGLVLAAALAEVAAIRETSVVLAALIGVAVPGADFGRRRVVAAFVIATGIVLIRPGKADERAGNGLAPGPRPLAGPRWLPASRAAASWRLPSATQT